MIDDFIARRSSVKLGGLSAICSGLLLGAATTCAILLSTSASPLDRFALLDWILRNRITLQWLTILGFLSQLCLLPVPFSSYQWLRANSTVRGGLLALSSFAGVASCVIDMVALATSFAIYAKAVEWSFEFAAWRADQVSIITVTAFIIAVATIFRLMSEILLSTWLIVVGMAMWPSHTKWTAAVVLMLGLVTLMVAVIKLVYPANPIEDWLGLVLGCGFIFVGIGLLRAKFKT